MNAHRLVLMIAAAALFDGTASRAADEKSWVGENVLPTKPSKEIKFGDRVNEKQIDYSFAGRWPIKVRGERDGWLRIHDGNHEGWVDKADFVLSREAPAYFDRRVQANPRDIWARYMRGSGFLDKGDADSAIKDFDAVIQLDSNYSRAYNGRGVAWTRKKEYDKAIKDLEDTVRLDPKYALGFHNLGYAWNAKNEYDKAIKDYDESIRLDPRYTLAYNNRGNSWYAKKDYDKAMKDYDEAIRIDPKFAVAFANRGNVWYAKNDFDKAIKEYDEAIRNDSKYAVAFNNRGNAWRSKKEYDKAIKDYSEAIHLNPKNAVTFNNRGYTLGFKKDFDKAIKDFDEAIRLDPKYAIAHNNRGCALRAKKEYDKAVKEYDDAIRIDPKFTKAHFDLAATRMLLRQPQAESGFHTVIDLQSGKGDYATRAVVLGHLAARQTGNESGAKKFLADSAGKLNEAWPSPAVKFLRGDIDEAALLKLATDDSKRTEVHCYLGLERELKGNKPEALTHFRWVKDHGDPALAEHAIAIAELDRLERAK